jgi:hypothetical protein
LGIEAQRRSNSWRIAALAVALAVSISMTAPLVRTQMWAWLPFILFVMLLSRFTAGQLAGRWLLLFCPLLMAFWVNLHGSFILGIVLVGACFAGEGLQYISHRWLSPLWTSAEAPEITIPIHNLVLLAATGGLTLVGTLFNPRTSGIFTYVSGLLTNSPIQQLVDEWQPTTPQGSAGLVFYASILLLVVVQVFTRWRPTRTDLLLMLGFLWLAWSGQRSLMWYGLAIMPIFAQAISQISLPNTRAARPAPSGAPKTWPNTTLAILLFLPALLVQPWWVEHFPLPETYWRQVQRDSSEGPLLSIETPVQAAAYLRNHPGGRLFHEMGYGSYLIWAVPEQGVFIDPRIELYPYTQWQDYIRISQGIRYNELLAQYGADRVLLSRAIQKGLAGELENDPCWLLEYQDDRTQLWTKVNPPPADCP